MPANTWRSFRQSSRALLDTAEGQVFAETTYRGQWEGVYEDAAILYGQVDDDVATALGTSLGQLAETFGQEAIGYAVGSPGLVGPGA
jgi:hypothetical protein